MLRPGFTPLACAECKVVPALLRDPGLVALCYAFDATPVVEFAESSVFGETLLIRTNR